MEIKVIAGDIARIKAGAIIVNFFEGMERPDGDIAIIDEAWDGATLTEVCRVAGPTMAG